MTAAVLQGTLEAFKLPEVLTFLQTTRKSGTLTVSNEERSAYVFFSAGALVYAGSNQEHFRLSAILLRKKLITREQFDMIDDLMQREGGRFGQLALQHGVLSETQLPDLLKVQVSEILYDCFLWHGGSFTFDERLDLPPYAVTIAVDLANLIMEGARRIEEWEQCLRLLPDKNVVFRVVSNPTKDGKITLSVDEWKILFLINGHRTLEDLCLAADDEPLDVYRVVYGLLANNLIEGVPRTAAREESSITRPLRPIHQLDDETVLQGEPHFGTESTVHDTAEDDTSLLVSEDARLSYADVVKPTVAQLTITSGEAEGTVIPLIDPEYLVGRQRDNTIQLNDLGVSGHHARIYRGPDGYVIEDLKSRNGVWLNGTRVFHGLLKSGDILRLGATDLVFDVLYDAAKTNAY